MLPVINEYERSSTTVINAYVRPIVERYLNRLIDEVKRTGIDGAAAADAVERRPDDRPAPPR